MKKNKRIESIDVTKEPSEYLKIPNVCLHLNGRVEGATEVDLLSRIKLSDSSYLSSDSFVSSKWYYHFKRDLETSSAIVFIGYSMYDIDIKKILFSNPNFIEKTYFIVKEGADFKETFALRKFGHIVPIGGEKFAELMEGVSLNTSSDTYTESLTHYEIVDSFSEVRDTDSENFLLYGNYETDVIQSSFVNEDIIPFSIRRNNISDCIEFIKSNKNLFIHSDLGNGKSVFLEELAFNLTLGGFQTYFLNNNEANYLNDIDKISNVGSDLVIIVDGIYNYPELIEYLNNRRFSRQLSPKLLSSFFVLLWI